MTSLAYTFTMVKALVKITKILALKFLFVNQFSKFLALFITFGMQKDDKRRFNILLEVFQSKVIYAEKAVSIGCVRRVVNF